VPARGPSHRIRFADALRFWTKLGFISFGGPAGQIAIMHRELVEQRRWISEERFLHALNYCMLLPGPEATQLATYVGWLLHRTPGGVAAGALFVLPSIGVLLALSWIYAAFGSLPLVAGVLSGFQPVVVAIVAEAVQRIGKRALQRPVHGAVAAASFTAIHFVHVPFPAIVLGAGLVGFACGRAWPDLVATAAPQEDDPASAAGAAGAGAAPTRPAIDDRAPPAAHTLPSHGRSARIVAAFVALWTLPYALLAANFGATSVAGEAYRFFTKAAFVTFGGGYAVLAYVLQVAVHGYGWLGSREAMVGLALAETTPGPLIMVLQFVGFMAGWHHPLEIGRPASAVLVALVTTYTTFLPSFLFILLGAPYVERLRGNRDLAASLSFVTAAVVGVVLNLAVVFAVAVLLPESRDGGVDWWGGAVALAAFAALSRRWSAVLLVALGGLIGLARVLLGF
jgi:chromate transporter